MVLKMKWNTQIWVDGQRGVVVVKNLSRVGQKLIFSMEWRLHRGGGWPRGTHMDWHIMFSLTLILVQKIIVF